MQTGFFGMGSTRRALGLAALLLSLSAATALAQDASVVYLEGEPEKRSAGGDLDWLDFGTPLIAGESVITGPTDFVELEQGAASTITVEPGTVFTIREVDEGGQRRQVMTNSVGAVRYRFNRIAGRDEPRVGTASVVAGIRGTEVTVYAGADGSSLFLVDSGEVEVSSAGQSVSLTEAQGVEVAAGQAPGEVFEVIGRELNFEDWAADRRAAFLDAPIETLDRSAGRLDEFAAEADTWYENYLTAKQESDAAFEQIAEIEDEDERSRFREENWLPLANQTGNAVLNYRYYALSALSLRRYVLGPMYMEMRTRNILEQTEDYQTFIERFDSIVTGFEDEFSRYLEEWDL